jgi:outer membrane protein, multidrug efflux system
MRFSFTSTVLRTAFLLPLMTILLASCAVGPNFHKPPVASPDAFRDAPSAASTNSLADLPWWSVFKDQTLQNLIKTALTNNYDLRIAISRVEQARYLQLQAQSVFLPQVGYVGEADRGKNVVLGLPTPNSGTLNSYVGAFDVLWEIDLWGRIRRLNEAARARLLASREAQRGIRLTLLSEVAAAYIQLLELDERLEIAQRTAKSFERTFKLFDVQHENGFASKLELSRASGALHSVSATIPDLRRQIAIKENEINVLLGQNPSPVPREKTLLKQEALPEVPTGLPAMLLQRRPDIREAEQELRVANAEIGVTVGDFFPRIGLTALYGGVSTELSALTSGGANAWSLAATTTGPIFQGGRLKARHRQAIVAREEAKLSYQRTALNAFREVADALVSRQQLEEARREQAEAVDAYRAAVEVSSDRYRAGKASYFEVLEAQQQLFPAENSLSQIEASQRLVTVQFYKALGGGWNLDDLKWSTAQALGNRSP